MSTNKQKARIEMLKKLSKDKTSEVHSGLGEGLKKKKLQKVEVIAEDSEGLAKGLSLAQKIAKAKLGDKYSENSSKEEISAESIEDLAEAEDCEESEDSEEYLDCEGCEEGCKSCEETEEA